LFHLSRQELQCLGISGVLRVLMRERREGRGLGILVYERPDFCAEQEVQDSKSGKGLRSANVHVFVREDVRTIFRIAFRDS
jgi:hypothetical protein